MWIFITCMALVIIFAVAGIIACRNRMNTDIIIYAAKQTCEHYELEYIENSLTFKRVEVRKIDHKKRAVSIYEFYYKDHDEQLTGQAIIVRKRVDEIILAKTPLPPKKNNPMFKAANEINNVIKFPKKD